MGVCGDWQLQSFDNPCTDGYTRVRTCDPAYDCRTTDHNGCSAALNVGGSPPPGCPACPGGGSTGSAGSTGSTGSTGGTAGGGGSLQYFGYWRDSDLHNFVCQIQDHMNFSMTGDSQGEVDLAASYGVANFGLVAPTAGAPPPLNVALLRDDADASAYGYCASNPCPNGIADGWAAIKAQIESDGDNVHATNPSAHLMINLADGDANGVLDFQGIPGFTLPRGVDWVGLECYTGAANCQANMNVLRPLLPPGGKAWVIAAGVNSYGTESWLVSDAQAQFAWASADPDLIGMIVFVWSNAILCPPDCTSLAVKEMPDLLAEFRMIGDTITGRGNIAPLSDSQCPPP